MVGFSFKCSSNFWGKSLWNSSLVFGIPNRAFVALLQAQQALQPGETWACFLWNSPSLPHYPLQYLSAKGLRNTQLNSHWAQSNTHRLNEQPTRCPQWGMAGLLLMICKSLHRLILVEGTARLLDDVSQAKCCAKARFFFFFSILIKAYSLISCPYLFCSVHWVFITRYWTRWPHSPDLSGGSCVPIAMWEGNNNKKRKPDMKPVSAM